MNDAFFAGYKQLFYVLQSAVAFVLLIAYANVAGLQLARATARRTEVAVRSALGAGRPRVIRQLLTESVLLSPAGGIPGVGLGWVGLRLIRASLGPGAILPEVTTDLRVPVFTVPVSILTGLLFGTAPALETSKVDLATSLKESGRTGMEGAGKQRVRGADGGGAHQLGADPFDRNRADDQQFREAPFEQPWDRLHKRSHLRVPFLRRN